MKLIISILSFIIIHFYTFSNEPFCLKVAKEELFRAYSELQKTDKPPYFISYHISDIKNVKISAKYGKIADDDNNHKRILDIDLRVGSYKFDNTHIIRGNQLDFSNSRTSVNLPLEDNPHALKNSMWLLTDRTYKKAVERYEKAITNKAVKVEEEDSSADFSMENPLKHIGKSSELKYDDAAIREILKRISLIFEKEKWIYSSLVQFSGEVVNKVFVSTEGTELFWSEPNYRISVTASTKADDGMSLFLYSSYFSFTFEGLPDEANIAQDAENIVMKLKQMREAPLMQTYSGPAILSGEASGVFFHEIFGHRVEGHRQKDPNSSQTFKNYVGQRILPEFIDVVFDPTMNRIKDKDLSGYYLFDDEGIKSKRVETVRNGIFQNFLMSRSPIENFDKSNGHGRKQAGYKCVSRQSNLIVSATKTVPAEQLKEMLRQECKKQGKDFGLYFEKVQGGFTFTGRTIPNSFNVNPLLVYKVYADGRPDEMVRGVDLIGTPLTTFSNIIAVGDDMDVFNGICGAESGGVSVSASSPSLLVSTIEVQKKAKSQAKPPILPAP